MESNAPFTCNAVVESAHIRLDRGCFLSAWLMLDYGGSGQGFGGYVLGGTSTAKAGEHHLQPNLAAEFIVACLQACGVEDFDKCVGKTIRVRKTSKFGDILGIGHIVKDDRWFHPQDRLPMLIAKHKTESTMGALFGAKPASEVEFKPTGDSK